MQYSDLARPNNKVLPADAPTNGDTVATSKVGLSSKVSKPRMKKSRAIVPGATPVTWPASEKALVLVAFSVVGDESVVLVKGSITTGFLLPILSRADNVTW